MIIIISFSMKMETSNWYLRQLYQSLAAGVSQEFASQFQTDLEVSIEDYPKYRDVEEGDNVEDAHSIWCLSGNENVTASLVRYVNVVTGKKLVCVDSDTQFYEKVYRTTDIPNMKTVVEEVWWQLAFLDDDQPVPEEFASKIYELSKQYFVSMSESCDKGFGSYCEFGEPSNPHILVKDQRDSEWKLTGYLKYVPTPL